MKRPHVTRTAFWKRFAAPATWTVLIAAVFSLTTAAWAHEPDNDSQKDHDRQEDNDRDRDRQRENNNHQREIDVATVNLYVGADFTPVLTLDPADREYFTNLVNGVAAIHDQILKSNFPLRAEALAEQIVRRDPDLVSLQEVSLIRRQSPSDLISGGTVPATKVELDYLEILLKALARHGGHYAVASQIDETDVEVPLFTGTSFDDVRLTDRDVILVRTDVPPEYLRTSNPQGKHFTLLLPLPIGVNALRGWCSVDVQVHGRSFRFITTHLEDQLPPGLPDIQFAQASELLADPAGTTMPVILAGDFNSDAYGHYSSNTYALLTGRRATQGRFSDSWTVAEPRSLGFTWGHDPLLADQTVPFIYRLDLILYRGKDFDAIKAVVVDPLIGRYAPRWFSDHGGVFTKIAID